MDDGLLRIGLTWLSTHLCLLTGVALLGVTRRLAPDLEPGRALRLAQGLLVASLVLPWLVWVAPGPGVDGPAVQVFDQLQKGGAPVLTVRLTSADPRPQEVSLEMSALRPGLAALALLSGLVLLRLLAEVLALRARLREMPLLRRIGRVHVRCDDGLAIPYSARLPGEMSVVLPGWMVGHPQDLHIATLHELEHHRQGHTLWVYITRLVVAAFPLNPAPGLWARAIGELQEFACDHALVGRRRVPPQAYGRCLLKAAQVAQAEKSGVPGTGIPAALLTGSFLERRVEMLFKRSLNRPRPFQGVALFVAAVVVLTTQALVASSAVQVPTVDLARATELARASSSPGWVVVMNEHVLTQLNKYLTNPGAKRYLREGISNSAEHRPYIERRLKEAGLPAELVVVPLIESGYVNKIWADGEINAAPPQRGAGLWMFIPSTARAWGMKVDEQVDERLDIPKETDAALAYLSKLKGEFGTWELALAAYNMGEKHVAKVIQERGTRDPWELVAGGQLNHYLPLFNTGLIVWHHPELVQGP